LAECPHYPYVRHRLEGAGIVVDELDVFAVWKRRAIVEYCVREIQNSGVGTPVIVAAKIVLGRFDELAETLDTFGIDVATVFNILCSGSARQNTSLTLANPRTTRH